METKDIVIEFFNEAKDKLNLKEEDKEGFLELMNDPDGRVELFNLSKDKLNLSSFEVFEDVLGYKEKSEGGDENISEDPKDVEDNIILTNNNPEELKKEIGVQSVAATVAPETDGALQESSIEQQNLSPENQEKSKEGTTEDKSKKKLHIEKIKNIQKGLESGLLKIKDLQVFTSNSPDRYGYVNRGDGSGKVELTKFEYDNLIEGEDPYASEIDEVKEEIKPFRVTQEEVSMDEQDLVPMLTEKLKGTNFKVEEAIPGADGIKITNTVTNQEKVFPIDAFTDEGDIEYANKINKWVEGQEEYSKGISEQKTIDETRKKKNDDYYNSLSLEEKGAIDLKVAKKIYETRPDGSVDRTKKLSTEEEKKAEEEKQKIVENLDGLDRLGIGFRTGTQQVGMSISSIPESIYNVFSIPQNVVSYLIDDPTLQTSSKRFKEKYDITNVALESYKEERENLQKLSRSYDINTYKYQGIGESISNGEYLDAFAQIGNNLAESTPVSMSIMAGAGMTTLPQLIGGSTLTLMGPEVMEQEEKNPDQNPLFSTVKGMGIAAAETFFSAINAKSLTFVYKDILLREGEKIAETTLRRGLLEMYQAALKKYGFPISALGGGFEEILTLQTQNVINGRPLNEGVTDAFILGITGGALYGAPINAINFANKVPGLISANEVGNKLKNGGFPSAYDALSKDKEVTKNVVDVINVENSIPAIDNKLNEEVSNNEITEEESESAKKKARQIQGILNSLKSLGLNDAQTLIATNLIIERSNLEDIIKKVGDSALTTKESDRIKEINEELSNMRTKTPEELAQERLEDSLEKEIVNGVESVVSEDIVTKEDVDIYTGNSPERYGSYAAGDGSGRVDITEEEYNALPDTLNDVTADTESTTADEVTEITKEDYDKFVDTGVVDEGIINYLAEKVRKNETLNEIEQAIFNDKTSDVEEALRTTTEQRNINNKAVEDVSKGNSVVKEGLKNLMNAMSSVFGLNSTQATASALIQDAIVATMAKREGISKEEMYEKIIFANAEKAPDGSLKQEPLIFKSTAKEGLSKLPNNPMTPEAWVKQITEKGGKGTSQELEWIGLNDYLNEWKKENKAKSVPKEVVEQYINDNQIEIVEVSKGSSSPEMKELKSKLYSARNNRDYEFYEDKINKLKQKEGTKWSKYTLEGGENYREVLLTLPPKPMTLEEYIKDARSIGFKDDEKALEKRYNEYLEDIGDDFSSSENFYAKQHFDEANILAHLRLNERTLPNGERVLFIEEVQSDWAQEGKKKGFVETKTSNQIVKEIKADHPSNYSVEQIGGENGIVFEVRDENGKFIDSIIRNDVRTNASTQGVPNMPYKKTDQWVGMAMRRVMQMAAQEGFDRVAWVTGEQSADRYDLSKQVDAIKYTKEGGKYNIIAEKNGVDQIAKNNLSESELESAVGKEVAQKIVNGEGDSELNFGFKTLTGQDLKVGGEGMKTFYNSILPKVAKKEAQRFDKGAKVEVVDLNETDSVIYDAVLEELAPIDQISENESGNITTFKSSIHKDGDNFVIEKGDGSFSAITKSENGKTNLKEFNSKKEARDFVYKSMSEDIKPFTRYVATKNGVLNEDGIGGNTKEKAISNYKNTIKIKEPSKQLSIPITPKMRMNLNGAVPLFQGARGAMTAADNQFVLYALTDPNVSTPVHEMAHVFEHYLTDQERNDILDWAGHTNWTTETSEKFARGFEKYLAGGKVSNPKLQEAFEQFKEWLTEIYNNIVGSDIDVELNEKMTNLYDSMLGGTVEETVEETTPEEESIDMGESTKRFVPRFLNKGLEEIRIALQDKWYSLSKLQKIAARDGYINPKDDLVNIYLEKELENGVVKQRIQNIIETIEGSKTFQGKSTFERMYKDGVNIDQLGLYMFAKHAQERNISIKNKYFKEIEDLKKLKVEQENKKNFGDAQDTEQKIKTLESNLQSGKTNIEGLSGMTDEQAVEIIKEVKSSGFTDKFDEYSKELREKLVDEAIRLKIESGLLSPEEAEVLKGEWEFYVPLKVDTEALEESGRSVKSINNKKGRDLYKLKGSDFFGVDDRVNPITGMIAQLTSAAKKAQANKVFNATFNLATELNEKNVTNIFGKPRKATSDDKSIKSINKVLVGYVNGVETAIEIKDARIQKAFEDKPYNPYWITRKMLQANNYLRAVNTLINPEFQLTNFIRDVQTAFVNISSEDASKMNTKMLKNIPAAMKGIFLNEIGAKNEWAEIYQELKNEGGDVSWLEVLDIEGIKKRVEKATESYKKSKSERNLKILIKGVGETLTGVTKMTEMASRLSAYKVAIDAGYSKKKAASLAKNLTVNFEKKGTAGALINTFFLFANASIQGSTLVLRAITKSGPGGRRARTLAGTIIGLSMINNYINKQIGLSDDDEEDIPEIEYVADFVRANNMVFMLPGLDENGDYKASALTIPLPYGYNVLWNTGQIAGDLSDKTIDKTEAFVGLVEQLGASFNPTGSGPLELQPIPTLFRPAMGIAINKTWTGGPIYTKKNDKLKSQSFYNSTSELSKETATYIKNAFGGGAVESGILDIPPGVLDDLASFAGGGIGRFAMNVIETADSLRNGEVKIKTIPFVRKLFIEKYEGRYLNDIYEHIDLLNNNKRPSEFNKNKFNNSVDKWYEQEKNKIEEKYPIKNTNRGVVGNRIAAMENLDLEKYNFKKYSFIKNREYYYQDYYNKKPIDEMLKDMVMTKTNVEKGVAVTKDVWEKLSANQKDNLKNDLIVKEAKKDWKSSFTDAKYQKLEAKSIELR